MHDAVPPPSAAGGGAAGGSLWVGCACSVVGAAVGLTESVVSYRAGLDDHGFTRGDVLAIVHALVMIPVLLGLLRAARILGSASLWRGSMGVFGSILALAPVGLIESDERPALWELALVVTSIGLIAGFAMAIVQGPPPQPRTATVEPPVATAAPADASSGARAEPIKLGYAGPDVNAAQHSIPLGILLLLAWLVLKYGVRTSAVGWAITLGSVFGVLALSLAAFAVWWGIVKLKLARRVGVLAAVSGILDLAMVASAAGALLLVAVTAVILTREGTALGWERARTPLLVVGILSVAWELAIGGMLAAVARRRTVPSDS